MKLFLTILAIALLLFNGGGAFYGGFSFIMHPDGSGLKMSLDYLKHTPFNNYLIPGIILVIANGFLSFTAIVALIFKFQKSAWFVLVQGIVLTGWIVIQIFMIQTVDIFHYILGSVGVILIVLGWFLTKYEK